MKGVRFIRTFLLITLATKGGEEELNHIIMRILMIEYMYIIYIFYLKIDLSISLYILQKQR